jgi:hypothetical protein
MEKINKFDQIIYCTNITFNKNHSKMFKQIREVLFQFFNRH